MDFLAHLNRHVTDTAHREVAESWWKSLCGVGGSNALKRNIIKDELFERFSDVPLHLQNFAKGLGDRAILVSQPVEQARKAINETSSMICAGPRSGKLSSVLCRISTALVVYTRVAAPRSRGPLPKLAGLSHAERLRVWVRINLTNSRGYYKTLGPDSLIRGQLPNAFWAPQEDINSLGPNPPANRLRAYLGLNLISDIEPQVMFRLPAKNASKMSVPTGWDAFDNENFIPQHSSPKPLFGRTKDLITGNLGSREVVTPGVRVNDTLPVRVL